MYPDRLATWGKRSDFRRNSKNPSKKSIMKFSIYQKLPVEGEGWKIVVKQKEDQERITASMQGQKVTIPYLVNTGSDCLL